ncbi:septum formation initiator family protein [Streptomyces sp. NPDC056160]|uniref:septum formation initiator family protein n=1 Tax=Streptomyces sp. NPDC056160 TaxID=3345731 RepID=UPI0035D7C70B
MSSKPEPRGRAARLTRLLPVKGQQAARAPFVLLVVLLLGGGLIGLLVLNSALSEGAFQMDDLKKDTKKLTDEEQGLQRDIDSYSAPDALQRRALQLGMVPGGDPAFLNPDGTVKGVPSAAEQAFVQDLPVSVRPPETLTATDPDLPASAAGAATPAPGQTGPAQTLPLTGPAGAATDAPAGDPAAMTAPQPATTPTPGR